MLGQDGDGDPDRDGCGDDELERVAAYGNMVTTHVVTARCSIKGE